MSKNDPFAQKKHFILSQLAQTSETNLDASPKGTVDVHLLDLIGLINAHEDMVTTSSCSGRLSVFLEGDKVVQAGAAGSAGYGAEDGDREKVGGKGQGGKWLYVTHEPGEVGVREWWPDVENYTEEAEDEVTTTTTDDSVNRRYVLYKFEAMVCSRFCSFSFGVYEKLIEECSWGLHSANDWP